MTEIQLTFTVKELDYIMNVLAARPFSEVNGLIAKIMNQANSQPVPKKDEEGATNGG